MKLKGIDISKWQGNINFKEVKEAGIDFVIIRAGYGTTGKDAKLEANVRGCERVGLPYGFYHYSYARNLDEAKKEVNNFLNLIKNYNPTYPLYVDMEDADGYKKKYNVNYATCINICELECKAIEEAGYYAGIYANLDWLNNKINSSKLDRFDKWVAQWATKCTYAKDFGMWQYTSDGKVNGIDGRVDMNYCYKDYPTIIKKTENEQKKTEKETKKENVKIVDNNVDKYTTYKIKSGDTLSGIAAKYNTTYQNLAKINNIADPDKIQAGDTIKVPKTTTKTTTTKTEYTTYKIKSGDTLSGIATKYNTTVDKLVKINNIKDENKIYAGDTIKVPKN